MSLQQKAYVHISKKQKLLIPDCIEFEIKNKAASKIQKYYRSHLLFLDLCKNLNKNFTKGFLVKSIFYGLHVDGRQEPNAGGAGREYLEDHSHGGAQKKVSMTTTWQRSWQRSWIQPGTARSFSSPTASQPLKNFKKRLARRGRDSCGKWRR